MGYIQSMGSQSQTCLSMYMCIFHLSIYHDQVFFFSAALFVITSKNPDYSFHLTISLWLAIYILLNSYMFKLVFAEVNILIMNK